MQALNDFRKDADTPHARAFAIFLCSSGWRLVRLEKRLELLSDAINNLAKAIRS